MRKMGVRLLSLVFCFLDYLARVSRWQRVPRAIRYAKWKARLEYLGDDVIFYPGVVIHGSDKVRIDRGTRIAEYVHMWGGGGIEIGQNVLIATHAVITSITHDKHAQIYAGSSVKGPVRVEDNVWIGSHCVILPGITIRKNAIIGAGAVVTRDVAAGDIVGGVPARSLKGA